MSQSVQQFWQLVAKSGLLSKSACNGHAIAFAESHGGRAPESAAQLNAFLILQGAITPYHGKVLSAGAAGPFNYGDYRVLDRVVEGPLQGMFRAEHREAEHKVGLWFLPADASNKDIAAAKKAVEYHKEIRSPYLSESYALVEADGVRFVVVEDLAGDSLAAQTKHKLSIGQACRVARELAEGLLPLHERGCPHGHVLAKNVLVDNSGSAKLLSYPFCEVSPGPADGGPSPVEDTKSLGRLLLSLVDGSPSTKSEELAARLKAIQNESSKVPPGVAKCIARMLGEDDKKLKHAAEVVVALAPFADASQQQTSPKTKPAFEAVMRGEPIPQEPLAAFASAPAPAEEKPAPKPAEPLIPKLSVDEESSSPLVRTRRRSSGPSKLVGMGLGGLAIVAIALGLWASGAFSGAAENAGTDSSNPAVATNTSNNGEPGNGDSDPDSNTEVFRNTEQNVAYTGKEYWVSPTAGDPIDFRYLPIGAQAYLAWRPADLAEHPQSETLLAGIPAAGLAMETLLSKHAGLPPEEIESIVVAFMSGENPDYPRTTAVVRTVSAVTEDVLKNAYPDLDSAQQDGKDVFFSGDIGFYIPPDDDHLLVSAPLVPLRKLDEQESPLQLALQNSREAALVNREIAILQRASDADRLVTLVFNPSFPFTEFKALWAGAGKEAAGPFREFFTTDTRACALSAHLTDRDIFLEFRVVGIPEIQAIGLAKMYQERVADFPRQWEAAMVNVNISDYSRKVLYRFPRMLQVLAEHVDAASYRDHATLRCNLPIVAGENLLFATQLAMIETSASGFAQPLTSGQAEVFANVSEVLAGRKISLEIGRDTLDSCIAKFADAAEVTVQIDGGALQLEGIAKNKSLGVDQEDTPAGAVLRAILNTADSRLVYVIKTEDDEEIVLVTTRAAAEERGDTIPPEFSTTSGNQE